MLIKKNTKIAKNILKKKVRVGELTRQRNNVNPIEKFDSTNQLTPIQLKIYLWIEYI